MTSDACVEFPICHAQFRLLGLIHLSVKYVEAVLIYKIYTLCGVVFELENKGAIIFTSKSSLQNSCPFIFFL